MGVFCSQRNFGFGKQMGYAGHIALQSYYGGGHFASVKAHSLRWSAFCSWMRTEKGIRDATKITLEIAQEYAAHIGTLTRLGEISAAYAQNLISSMNVSLQALRGRGDIYVSPSTWTGRRCTIRTSAPTGFARDELGQVTTQLRSLGLTRAAALTGLCREFGVRMREAALADLDRWLKEFEKEGAVNIQDGCKGGRDAERRIQVTSTGLDALRQALRVRPTGSRNLIAPTETYAKFVRGELKQARAILRAGGIRGYHDLRAAYACERYEQETGHPAPSMGGIIKDRKVDRRDRLIIAEELGHNRIDVTAEYLGGRKS